ncbi:uncharacterized protein EHS24_004864 [Apiotrichum porosum]|uniref:Uncharacterized protein n=1 Tax=Apiotrichum porosum TaxID=105984 RepID=A0A427Y687_9TREE|nr:uncharacterized protein EHS24_004864 [Apiotrichum porosum]RSH86595.1 hypothetical protein EHS24_004864 [Apiotrichum porosum]
MSAPAQPLYLGPSGAQQQPPSLLSWIWTNQIVNPEHREGNISWDAAGNETPHPTLLAVLSPRLEAACHLVDQLLKTGRDETDRGGIRADKAAGSWSLSAGLLRPRLHSPRRNVVTYRQREKQAAGIARAVALFAAGVIFVRSDWSSALVPVL